MPVGITNKTFIVYVWTPNIFAIIKIVLDNPLSRPVNFFDSLMYFIET